MFAEIVQFSSTPFSKKKNEFKRVGFRLREWGIWYINSLSHGLGFPKQSITETAGHGSRATGPSYPKDNVHAEEVHIIIAALNKIHPEWAAVIKAEYSDRGTQIIKAKTLEMSRNNYRIALDKAKAWIEARLS